MPKISGRNIAKNNNNNLPVIDKRIKKAEPNPIDEDIFINAKQTLKNAQKDQGFRVEKNMMKTNLKWQAEPNSQPPPHRKHLDGKSKQYVGIGRIGIGAQSEGDKPIFKPKGQFNVSEGRDYTLDAPVKIDDEMEETPLQTNKKI